MSVEEKEAETKSFPAKKSRTVSISVSAVLQYALIVILLTTTIIFGFLYNASRSEIAARDTRSEDNMHAQQVATDYAVGASTIDYRNTTQWLDKLKTNTTPQLAAKFDATSQQLEEILLPLQWTSTATPVAAMVTSESEGIYKVNSFLNVKSVSAQNPDGILTTVAYAITIDRNNDWKITDVGGMDGILPPN